MFHRTACILLLTAMTAISQTTHYEYGPVNFGPIPKHVFNASQGEVRILLRSLPADRKVDWTLGVKVGTETHTEVMKVLLGKQQLGPMTMNVIADMQAWENLRIN